MRKNNKGNKKMRFDAYLENLDKNKNFKENNINLRLLSQIFYVMKEKKISNAELAKKMNVSRPYITKLFTGNCNFTIKTLINITNAIDCEIDIVIKPIKHNQVHSNHHENMKEYRIACKPEEYR